MEARTRRRWVRAGALTLGLLPITGIAIAFFADRLGANPIEELTHETGEWALRFLILSLAITPLRKLTGWRFLALERRTFGLLAFFYASVHLSIYAFLDLGLDLAAIAEDVLERPYVTAGFTAFCLMVPLAATSTRGAARRLGRRWKPLHRLAYVAGVAAVVHFLWLVKADLAEPLVYAGLLALVLGARLWWWLAGRAPRPASSASANPTAIPE